MGRTTSKIFILIIGILFFQGCDFTDRPAKDLDVYHLKKQCELNTDAFSHFLEKDITRDIDCLEINFNQFMAGVLTGDTNGIRQNDLVQFVREYFDGDTQNIVASLDLLFNLNTLLLNDYECRIQRQNIKPIFEILRTSNQYLVKIKKIYKEINDRNALYYRSVIDQLLGQFTNSILLIIKNREAGPHIVLNTNHLVEQILDHFSDNTYRNMVNKLIPILKVALLGGQPDQITYTESISLIKKASKILMVAFDGIYLQKHHFQNINDFYHLQLQAANHLPGLLNQNFRIDDVLFTHQQIIDLADEVIKILAEEKNEKLTTSFLDKILKTLKPIAIGGVYENYTYREVLELCKHLSDFLEIRFFYSTTWDHYESSLVVNAQSYGITILPPSNYPGLSQEKIYSLHKVFNKILKQYRFFKKENGLQYYTHGYKRNKASMLEIAYYRWALGIVGKPYSESAQEIQISMKTLERLLWDFKSLLEEFNLWSAYPETFARNTILLGDLFQYQSDGNLLLNVDEASEYFILVVNAVTVKNEVTQEMSKVCDFGADVDNPTFQVQCFRKNLPAIMFNNLGYQEYMPMLYDYLKKAGPAVFQKYLYKVEYFARDIPDDTIPIGPRDMTLILGALLNIESTFIRFDTDKNNIINPKELCPPAYGVYKQAIIDLVHQKDPDIDVTGYEKSIFLYLVKKMEIPTKLQLGLYHLSGDKKFDSHRANIGAILYNLIKMNKEKLLNQR
ncbi:MAG: hypothetical protein A2381_17675 [Bdellovibrionales bacterium RIFOXYB1_FULL_37_110]|nr:MAG: hypothetical protein A2181_00800 [Bdellovibrionales bacterium RIFOXYA1_FULL_38_20]OFZ48020.1 MAG: hypothetical protein A2417_15650 [Bdellovibrionales bacterium RIFOXYC1_FULL_37_79]OFZ58037.1 MAG: hypothetical protein A2381_17675 [Bdellovibrionales bacterium RIFOXYB1_FULL_37_110]OFZ61669.1 MAG: hypothetical protein A2577_18110 [Bdellovibrionales bacterium RIFOXYD1_FULL_36_51]